MANLSSFEAMRLIATTEFRPFSEDDWACFAGCESQNPLIGFNGIYAIVIDSGDVNIIAEGDEFGGQLFDLVEAI